MRSLWRWVMRNRRLAFWVGAICLVSCGILVGPGADSRARAQQAPAGNTGDVDVIRAETRLVLVDTVVTDKKGAYVRDLAQKDFKVWEDGKEQAVTSFSYEESTGENDAKPRYMVLFFDNASMDIGDQAMARTAATKFIESNAGPNRLMAVAEFGGTITISQEFTADAARLKQVVSGVKGSAVSPNAEPTVTIASLGAPPVLPSLGSGASDFGVRTVLLALRSLAKSLSVIPGRKTLVMLTSGFVLLPEHQPELTAVIDACNKSNVAIYPIDVRGLVAPNMGRMTRPGIHHASTSLVPAAFHDFANHSQRPALSLARFAEPVAFFAQHGGGGGGGGGGHGGGGTGGGGTGGGGTGGGGTGGGGHGGGGTGGTGGTGGGGTGGKGGGSGNAGGSPAGLYNRSLYNQPRQIVPQFPPSASNNQQVLYQLADGTGGFVILNTNDLAGGLDRIAKDLNQYYLLGYKPSASAEGSCHSLKVKVDRGGTSIRARSGYCNTRPVDLLAGNPIEKDLESRAGGEMKGNVAAVMQAPFFYTASDTVEIHSSALKFEKVKGKQHAALNILGIAYKGDNSIAARFSDTVNLDLEGKKEVEEFQKRPFDYENQFGIASGEYKLKVVFSSGNASFGKLEAPLVIDPYADKQFSISAVALSNSVRRTTEISTDLDSQLLEDRTPLLVQGMQISPSASNHFKKTDGAAIYAEVYEPLLKGDNAPDVGYELVIVERQSGTEKFHVGGRVPKGSNGNPVIPVGLKLPVAMLDPGRSE